MESKRVYSERTKKIFRITIPGSVTNALLVNLKLFVGIFGHSSAMIAEAINSISDFATDLIALVFIRISGKPRDKDHHYGHGKYETLASVVMASVMMGVGAVLLYRSSCTVIGLLSGHITRPQPSRLTLIIAIISLLLKAVLYRYTMRWAGLLKSSATSQGAGSSGRHAGPHRRPPGDRRGDLPRRRMALPRASGSSPSELLHPSHGMECPPTRLQ